MVDLLAPALASKLAKLIPLLSSDNDGETLATVRAIDRMLKAGGADFHALARSVAEPKTVAIYGSDDGEPEAAPQAKTLLQIARLCRSHHGGRLTSKELEFVATMLSQLTMGLRITDKQERWLRAIYCKIGGYAP